MANIPRDRQGDARSSTPGLGKPGRQPVVGGVTQGLPSVVLAATKNAGVRPVSSRFAAIRIPVPRPSAVRVAGGVFSAGRPACRDAGGPSGVDGFEVIRLLPIAFAPGRGPAAERSRTGRCGSRIALACDHPCLTQMPWSGYFVTGFCA